MLQLKGSLIIINLKDSNVDYASNPSICEAEVERLKQIQDYLRVGKWEFIS